MSKKTGDEVVAINEKDLRKRFSAAQKKAEEDALPGALEYRSTNAAANKWINERLEKLDRAIRDEDVILFERALAEWNKGWTKINTTIAERYRAANEDPEQWELRYIKWMKLTYIKFEGSMGTFFLVPRNPTRRPKAEHWFTVDEMLGMLEQPGFMATIKTFGQLPIRKDVLGRPKKRENHMHVNFTDDGKPPVYYDFHKGVRRG